MKFVGSKSDIEININTLENYLVNGTEEEQEYTRKLIRNGKCFVAYEVESEVRFVPSRFVGYKNNKLSSHLISKTKDGRETNPVITKILNSSLEQSDKIDAEYIHYCKKLGETASNYSKRKFWLTFLTTDFIDNKVIDGEFPEGKIVERIHRSRERNRNLIEVAKKNFKVKYGKLFCQICNFNFEETYGKLGEDFIEAHHTIPVSEMKPNHISSPDDLAMLCANCHRMVHKRRPWLTMDNLESLIQ